MLENAGLWRGISGTGSQETNMLSDGISCNEYLSLEQVLVKSPDAAFLDQQNVSKQWADHRYLACPDYDKAVREHAAFVEILTKSGAEVLTAPRHELTGIDSLYIRDSSIVTPAGMILCAMGKEARASEPGAVREFLESSKISIIGEITTPGALEGGDVVWIDDTTLVVADGYRTNGEGIRQLQALLPDVEIIRVPLPHWNGPEDVLHLMSFLSPVDRDLAVVYPRIMPVPFLSWLVERGIRLVEVPDAEYDSMACNVLALGPRDVLMLEGNPQTRQRLEAAGCRVQVYEGYNISFLGSGGPTCLTRPVIRRA
jgi:N-dimethylarginine dimethylaminohydrolase